MAASGPEQPLRMDFELARLTLEVVSRAVFGMDIEGELGKDELRDFLHAFEEHFPLAARSGQIAIMFPIARYGTPVGAERLCDGYGTVINGYCTVVNACRTVINDFCCTGGDEELAAEA